MDNRFDFSVIRVSPSFSTDHAVFAATRGDGVYRPPDRGNHWTLINAGLANVNVKRARDRWIAQYRLHALCRAEHWRDLPTCHKPDGLESGAKPLDQCERYRDLARLYRYLPSLRRTRRGACAFPATLETLGLTWGCRPAQSSMILPSRRAVRRRFSWLPTAVASFTAAILAEHSSTRAPISLSKRSTILVVRRTTGRSHGVLHEHYTQCL